MGDHAAIRAGDERAQYELLLRLARQTVGRSGGPPMAEHAGWTDDALDDLLGEVFARKGQFVEAGLLKTTTDSKLELYLLTAIENVLRDMGRETERFRLMARLETILGAETKFFRHRQPYKAWRLRSAPDVAWQGDIGRLIAAALRLRGVVATAWNRSGPTPRSTRDAIVRVSEAALDEAAGFVRDPDLAEVVQKCVPAVPLDADEAERPTDPQSVAIIGHGEVRPGPDSDLDVLPSDAIADAIWHALDGDERRAVPHLASDRAVASALGVPRRTGAAIAASAKVKIRSRTTAGTEADVVQHLCERANSMENV
jgi:hypothetical protein